MTGDVCVIAVAVAEEDEDDAMLAAGEALAMHLRDDHGLNRPPARPLNVCSASFDNDEAMARMEADLAVDGVPHAQWVELVDLAKSKGQPMLIVAYFPTPPDSPHKARLVN